MGRFGTYTRARGWSHWTAAIFFTAAVVLVAVPSTTIAAPATATEVVDLHQGLSGSGTASVDRRSGRLSSPAQSWVEPKLESTFQAHQVELARAAPAAAESCGDAVAWGDVDGNGRADIAIGCELGSGTEGLVSLLIRNAANDAFVHEGEYTSSAPAPNERCGHALALGDLNGDGRDDLVMSCWYGDVGADVEAGYVRIFLRDATNTGFDPGLDLSAATPQSGEHCGASVAIGDVNGDALGDVVVGCSDWGPGGADTSGSVLVFTRSAGNNGFDAAVRLSRAVPEAGDQCGVSVASGDVDGDGRDDVVTGCSFASPGAVAGAGLVLAFVRRAANDGFDPAVELVAPVPEANEACGSSVRVADVDDDDRADVFAGCMGATVGANAFAGRILTYLRDAANSGFDAATDISDASWAAFAQCGTDVALGDVDRDGNVDVVAGCPYAAPGGTQFAGAAEVMLGDGSGQFSQAHEFSDPAAAAFDFNQCGAGVAVGDYDGDAYADIALGCLAGDSGVIDSGTTHIFTTRFSWAFSDPTPTAGGACGSDLAAADLDGDLVDEVLIGCPDAIGGGGNASGVVVAMPMASDGTGPDAAAAVDLAPTSTAGDDCGASIATGDVDANGLRDVVIGCPGANGSAGLAAVYVANGSPGSISLDAPILLQHPSATAGDVCGTSVAAADVNRDSLHDVVIGCPGSDVGGAADAGAAVVFLRTEGGFGAGVVVSDLPAEAGAECGTGVAAGDLTGDSQGDVLVGCPMATVGSDAQAGKLLLLPRSSGNDGFDVAEVVERGSEGANELCGSDVGIGDVNADGRNDLVFGCPHAEVGGIGDAGAAVLRIRNAAGTAFLADEILGAPVPTTGDGCGFSVLVADLNTDGRDDVSVGCAGAAPNLDAGAGMSVIHVRNAANSGFEPAAAAWEGTMTAVGDACGSSLALVDADLDATPDLIAGCAASAAGDGDAHVYVNKTVLGFPTSTTFTTAKLNQAPHEIASVEVSWLSAAFGGSVAVQASVDGGGTWRSVSNGVERLTPEWDDDLRLRFTLTNQPGSHPARMSSLAFRTVEPIYPDIRPPRIVQLTSSLKFFNSNRRGIRYLIEDTGPGTVTGLDRVRATYKGKRVAISRTTGVDTHKLPEGRGWLVVRAWDRAGNVASRKTRMKIDRTAPTIKGRKVKHIIGGFDFFRMQDNVSGSRFAAKRIWAHKPGRNVHRIPISDRAGNTARRKAATYRHISLAAPWYNRRFSFRGGGHSFEATQANLDFVFGFRYTTAPWYQQSYMTGAFLREVQWRLRFLGYLPKVYRSSGAWDMPTIEAIKRFQEDHGIPAIATVGPQTRDALDAELWKELGKA